MKSLFLLAPLAVATLGITGLLWFDTPKNAATESPSFAVEQTAPTPLAIVEAPPPTPTPSDAVISVAMVGDILPLWVNEPLRDAGVRARLQGADIAFANLEAPLSTRGQPAPLKFRKGRLMRREFIFGADDAAAQMLKNAGVDVVSLANNHMMDYGATALDDTLSSLQKRGIAAAGAGANASAAARPVVVERQGVKVAFVALVSGETLPGSAGFEATSQQAGITFARDDGKGAPDSATRDRLRTAIAAAHEQADVVAVSVHWGTEFHTEPNPFQRALAHFIVDAGADVVVGHHPHCLQGVEVYRGKPIFYSLGNFVFHSKLQKSAPSGIAHLEVSAQGVESAAFSPVWVWDARPQTDHPRSAQAATLLRDLSSGLGTASFFAERDGKRELRFELKSPASARSTRVADKPKIASKSNVADKPEITNKPNGANKPNSANKPNGANKPEVAAQPKIAAKSKSAAKSKANGRMGGARADWVEARRAVAGLVVERPYASTRNVFKTRFYADETALLRRGTASKLRAAQTTLARRGARLKLWDGYRPPAIQKKMWEQVRDARYVADPNKGGSRHNRGCAVDVTLVGKDGRELEMPTNYDDFSARAHADAPSATPAARRHRALLRAAMTTAGFKPLATEWWHFDDSQCAIYPIAQAPKTAATSSAPATKAENTGAKSEAALAKMSFAKPQSELANAKFKLAKVSRETGDAKTSFDGSKNRFAKTKTNSVCAQNRFANAQTRTANPQPSPHDAANATGDGIAANHARIMPWRAANFTPVRAVRRLAVNLKLKRKFAVATGPKSLRASPSGNLIVINNLYAHCITLIEPATGRIRRRIEVPGEPVECVFTEGGRKVWVSLYDKDRVVVIDLIKNRVVAQIPTGQIPKVVEVSRDGKWVYAANWSSQSITVMDAVKLRRVKDVKVGNVPRGIAFTRDGRFAYVANMGGDSLSKIDVKNGHRVVKTIRVGGNPRHLVMSRDGRRLYISHNAGGVIRKLDTATDKVMSVARVGRQPRTIALSRDDRLLFVCNYEDNNIGVVDVTTMRQISTTPTSVHPVGATVARDGTLWISNYRTNIIMQFEVQRKLVKAGATRAQRT